MNENIDGEYAARTRLREAEWLAEQRKRDPAFDPWRKPDEIRRTNAEISSDQEGGDDAGGVSNTAPAGIATQQAQDALVGMPPRDALRAAQQAHREAVAARDRAQELADRAKQRAEQADAELADYADLDERITAFYVRQIESDAQAELPYPLARAQAERGKVVDKIAAAHKPHARLAGQTKAADQQVQQAHRQLQAAATRVITQHAEELADELADAEQDACDKRTQLLSLARSWLPLGQPGPTALPPRVQKLLTNAPPRAHEDGDAIARWRDWHQRLIDDADAAWDGSDARDSSAT
jgi:hypothetical protein